MADETERAMSPRDAARERQIIRRVENEANRANSFAGRFAEPKIAPRSDTTAADDPYTRVGTPVDVVGQQGAGNGPDPYAEVGRPVEVQKPLAWSDVPGKALANTPASAANLVQNIVHAVMHPIDTAGSIADAAAGGLRAGAKAVLPDRVFRAIDSMDEPGTTARISSTASAIGDMLADRYGSAESLKQTLAADPVGVLADASAVLTGGGSALARVPGYAGRIGRAVANAGNSVDPIAQTARLISRSGNAVAEVLGTTTGAGTRPFRQAYDAGRTGNQAFTENMRGQVPVADVVDLAEGAVDRMSRARSAAYNRDMANVNTSRAVVDYAPLRQAARQGIDEAHFRGIPIDETAANVAQEISDIVERFATSTNRPGQPMVPLRTPAELDAAKRAIGEVRQRTQQGTLARRIADNVYRAARDEVTRQVPEYAAAMRNYSEASDLLQQMRRTMSINDRAMPDTTVRKLQSTMRNNVNTNYGMRETLLDELARLEPDLPYAIAGQSLNALAPRSLARAAGPIEAMLALLHNPLALAALPLSSPRGMGEVVHAAGRVAGAAERTLPRAGVTRGNALAAARSANISSVPERANEHKKKHR